VLASLRVIPAVGRRCRSPFFARFLDEDDEFVPNAELEVGAKGMVEERGLTRPS
jgi:hypothetical protein